jgi:hypothetical protein
MADSFDRAAKASDDAAERFAGAAKGLSDAVKECWRAPEQRRDLAEGRGHAVEFPGLVVT